MLSMNKSARADACFVQSVNHNNKLDLTYNELM